MTAEESDLHARLKVVGDAQQQLRAAWDRFLIAGSDLEVHGLRAVLIVDGREVTVQTEIYAKVEVLTSESAAQEAA